MSDVKEAIEAIIEESYLLGLSEEEIRNDFKSFIDTCYGVIETNVTDRKAVNGLAESLAREKTCTLISERSAGTEARGTPPDGEASVETGEPFAERVAQRKRLILKTIAEYDPKLVRLIDEERFQGDYKEVTPRRIKIKREGNWERAKFLLLKFGYATTIAVIVLLIYLSFLQKS